MRFSRKFQALALTALCFGTGAPAYANKRLVVNNPLTADGYTFTVASCSYQADGVTSACMTLNDILTYVGNSRGGPTIDIMGHGLSNALSGTTMGGATELTFTLNVTSATSGAAITSVSNAITGSPSPASGVFSNLSYGSYSANTTLGGPDAATAAFASPALTVANPLSVTLTLGLAAGSATTLTLAADALHFSPAPEPASIALLGTGVTGLMAIRRRRSKR